ncbi:non-structural maintenance of chromosomes element 3 homolog isoform X2 [Paroedura picta]|uniref:non-structural maintenance of chromosomes element 3 homolog isoform X2 n=1 Tax=Paroedura picta TaxID=143630 RepID=UPI004057581A
MSQKKRTKRPGPSQVEPMDVDEEYTLTQTPSSSQLQRNVQRRPPSQMEARVNELVRFLLVKDQKKIPIKRADILKHLKDYRDVCPELLNRANQTLQQVFGLELVEIDPKSHAFILVNKLAPLERENCKEEKHKIFGDVKKLVTDEFVKQKYLEVNRLPHTEPPEFEFRWGPRAAKETSKKQILQFVAKIQGKDPTFWTSQYNEAETEANPARRH